MGVSGWAVGSGVGQRGGGAGRDAGVCALCGGGRGRNHSTAAGAFPNTTRALLQASTGSELRLPLLLLRAGVVSLRARPQRSAPT